MYGFFATLIFKKVKLELGCTYNNLEYFQYT